MDNTKIELSKNYILIPIFVALGIMLSGYFISNTMLKAKQKERYVTVKGLSERTVAADLAIWEIIVRERGTNVTEINAKVQSNVEEVKAFLLKNGFKEEEFEMNNFVVADEARTLHDGSQMVSYKVAATIMLKTKNIEAVKKALSAQQELASKGILIGPSSEYASSGPMYEFTAFNNIKNEMLSEAIQNARKAAEQFAKDANCSIGELKKANQGSFVIVADVAEGASSEHGYTPDHRKSINKQIRAVTTLEYELK